MNRWGKTAVGMLMGVSGLMACGGSDDATSSADTTTNSPDTALRDVSEVEEENQAARTVIGTVGGDPIDLDGLRVSLPQVDAVATEDFSGRYLPVHVRIENPSESTTPQPDIVLLCADDSENYFMVGSTYPTDGRDMPPGTFAEGIIRLSYPEDCVAPIARFDPLVSSSRTPIVVFGLDTAGAERLTERYGSDRDTTEAAPAGLDSPAAVASLLADRGIQCTDFVDDGRSDTPPLTNDGSCASGDLIIEISVFESETAAQNLDQSLGSYADLLAGFGVEELSWVQFGPVTVAVTTTSGDIPPRPSAADLDLLERIASEFDARVNTYSIG